MQGRKNVGIRDVARSAGVSVATVSRVLAAKGYPVAGETRQRVLQAVEELGFVPNLVAKTFSTSKTDTIGVAMPVLSAYYAKMLAGIESRATESGLSLLLTLVGADHQRRERAIDQFLARQLDAMVICSGSLDRPLDRGPDRLGIPAIIIGQQPSTGFPTVTVDNHRAGYEATAHLIAQGHRRIVFLTGDSKWLDFRDRLAGFQDRLAEEGDGWSGEVVAGVFEESDAYDAVKRLVSQGTSSTAILAATDRHALGALAALADMGVKVPEQMAVVGFDNYHTSQFLRPALTSVDLPADVMGATAVDMIVSALSSKGAPVSDVVLEPRLVLRQSS